MKAIARSTDFLHPLESGPPLFHSPQNVPQLLSALDPDVAELP
jgi:hypothetical protein